MTYTEWAIKNLDKIKLPKVIHPIIKEMINNFKKKQ